MTEDEIQQVRLQFIRELQQDKVLSIESLLSTIPKSERSSLQANLLKIELEHRLKAGEDVSAEAYLKRYPDHEALIREAFDAAKEGLALAETVLSDQVAETAANDDADPSGDVGPYTIVRKIGQGGMGQVFVAKQRSPIRRLVALKIIRTDASSRQVVARFEAERHAMGLMNHENVARVYDAGVSHDGQPYFAMELIHGVAITRHCDNDRLSIRDRMELFMQACRGIAHAHQKGILHRDIKPSNVLVTTVDGRPVVKVIDFGLAKALTDRRILSQRDHFTQIGQVVGTLEYMSPEQADLTRVDVDARTDVYSLGVLFYELLTGSTPLIRSRIRNVPFDEVLSLIREEDAPRLSQRVKPSDPAALAICERRQTEPRKLARMLTGDIERIAAKALQKECTLRYAGPADLAADVERYLTGKPVTAAPPTKSYRLKKWCARRARELVAGGIVSVALLIATVGFVLQHREKQRAAAAVALRDKRILYRDSVIETQNQVTLIALAQSPRYHEAVEAIDAMLLEPRASPDLKYNAACVYSRAAEFLQNSTGTLYSNDVEILLKTSCDLLLKLARNGYFSDGDQVTNLLTDPDIAAARERPEFDIIIEETARRRQSAP